MTWAYLMTAIFNLQLGLLWTGKQMLTWVVWQSFINNGAHTLPVWKYCPSAGSCEELLVCLPPPSPPYAFFWEPWRKLLGCPVRCPHCLPLPCCRYYSVLSTQAGPSCVNSWMLVYLGRQAEALQEKLQGKARWSKLRWANQGDQQLGWEHQRQIKLGSSPSDVLLQQRPLSCPSLSVSCFQVKSKQKLNSTQQT